MISDCVRRFSSVCKSERMRSVTLSKSIIRAALGEWAGGSLYGARAKCVCGDDVVIEYFCTYRPSPHAPPGRSLQSRWLERRLAHLGGALCWRRWSFAHGASVHRPPGTPGDAPKMERQRGRPGPERGWRPKLASPVAD